MGMGHALLPAGVDIAGAMDKAVGGGAKRGDRDVVALHLV